MCRPIRSLALDCAINDSLAGCTALERLRQNVLRFVAHHAGLISLSLSCRSGCGSHYCSDNPPLEGEP